MTPALFDELAETMVWSYMETAAHSRRFRDEYGQPPNSAAKTHHFRSLVQIQLDGNARFTRDPRYGDYGRIAFSDHRAEAEFLVRSARAVEINQANEGELFDTSEYVSSAVIMIVFSFDANGLHLSYVATKKRTDRFRLVASGKPRSIGSWGYLLTTATSFQQGVEDPFAELGDIVEDVRDDQP